MGSGTDVAVCDVTVDGCEPLVVGLATWAFALLLVRTRMIFWSMDALDLNENHAKPSCLPSGSLITVAGLPSCNRTEAMTAFSNFSGLFSAS